GVAHQTGRAVRVRGSHRCPGPGRELAGPRQRAQRVAHGAAHRPQLRRPRGVRDGRPRLRGRGGGRVEAAPAGPRTRSPRGRHLQHPRGTGRGDLRPPRRPGRVPLPRRPADRAPHRRRRQPPGWPVSHTGAMGSGGRRLLFIAVCAAAAMPFVPLAHASTYTDQSPPGANDWSCKPTTAHPRPLVLVHGLGATAAENWNYLSPILKADGYCVFALTYGVDPRYPYMGGVVAMEQSSHELDAFVHRVLTATGVAQVDLVGHSEGTVMPQYWLWKLGGAPLVHEYVALTPLYDGTTFNGVATLESYDQGGAFAQFASGYCGSCLEFIKGSPFLTDLYKDGVAAPGVHYTTIMTTHDELVTPYTSGN